jgi:hypothetical protein
MKEEYKKRYGMFQEKYQTEILEDSKMATRGRKQKACFLKQTLGEMLEIHLGGKTTKKRQNSHTSTPPACA